MKKTILVIFIILTYGCSYEPIFSQKNYNFEITEISFSGEKKINKNIKSKLSLFKSSDQQNKIQYKISIYTELERKIISKDSKGDPLKFELVVSTTYEISKDQKLLISRKIEKSNIYNNISDKFKLEQSEKNILENLSEIISETIISSIINLDDN